MWLYRKIYVRFLLILICHFLIITNITEANRVFLKKYSRNATQLLQNLNLKANLYNKKLNQSLQVPEDQNQPVHTIDPYRRALSPSSAHYLLTNLYNTNLNKSTQVQENQNQTVHAIDPHRQAARTSLVNHLPTNLYNTKLNKSTQVPEHQKQTVHAIDPHIQAARTSLVHHLPTNLYNINLIKSTRVPEDQNQTVHTIDPYRRALSPSFAHYQHSPIEEREAHNETLTAFYREHSAVTKALREGDPLTQHEANQHSSASSFFQFQPHHVKPVHIVMIKHKFPKGKHCN